MLIFTCLTIESAVTSNHGETNTYTDVRILILIRRHEVKFDLKPNILCQLFDAFVGFVLSYGSEIWGFGKSKTMERVHLKFCKRLLNVRQNYVIMLFTANLADFLCTLCVM